MRCPSGRTIRRRARDSGFTLLEILVALAIFSVVIIYAFGSMYYSRKAADRTDKVDDYREMRIVFNRIARDLQDASRVKVPTYDYHSYRLVMGDSRDQDVVYKMQDDTGTDLLAEPPPGDTKAYHVVRVAGAASDAKSETIRQTGRILWMKFTRLGERLVGLTVRMRPRDTDKPGAVFTATMSVSRVML